MKKILIIIGFLLLVIGLGFLLYLTFFKPSAPGVIPPIIEEPEVRLPVSRDDWERMTIEERDRLGLPIVAWPEDEETLIPVVPIEEIAPPVELIPEIAQGGLTQTSTLSLERTFGASLSADGQSALYYNRETGYFYKIKPDGEPERLTDQIFNNVQKINWAPTKDKAILEYPDGYKIIYDFNTKKQVTLPFNWYDLSFSPTGQEIAFKLDSKYSENRWLSIASADGTGARAIEHMGDNADKVIVDWSSNKQVIAFTRTGEPRGAWQQSVLSVGRYGEKFAPIIVDGIGFEHIWDKLGEKIAYSVYSPDSDYNPSLYVINAAGDNAGYGKINTGLQTYSSKCTFNQLGDSLY
ncbi:MAG: hypothetical protein KGZ97_11695, partial [Bacteroidetes bacterium]|nr:hypothetical protein [Bacteroidota bacterium]